MNSRSSFYIPRSPALHFACSSPLSTSPICDYRMCRPHGLSHWSHSLSLLLSLALSACIRAWSCCPDVVVRSSFLPFSLPLHLARRHRASTTKICTTPLIAGEKYDTREEEQSREEGTRVASRLGERNAKKTILKYSTMMRARVCTYTRMRRDATGWRLVAIVAVC